MLTHLGSNRTERNENARWAFLAKGPVCSTGFEPGTQTEAGFSAGLMLTHLGSNQDSAEPKSVVLPVTPWVNRRLTRRCKNNIFFYGFSGLLRFIKDERTVNE